MADQQVKQVIVIRRDLKMRRGKEVAQGSHASLAPLALALHAIWNGAAANTGRTPALEQWLAGDFTKVCLAAESEEQLMAVYQMALTQGVPVYLITDAGKTEFHGVPTNTALSLGPDYADRIDAITGLTGAISLKLY